VAATLRTFPGGYCVSQLFDLSDRTALVTGACGGLGRAIVQAMADEGATLLVSDRLANGCEEIAQGLRGRGTKAWALPCDLSRFEDVDALATAAEALGRIDVLVCNAGIPGTPGLVCSASDAEWNAVMTVNLRSAMWLSARLIPAMARRRRGSVILMSSIAGLRGNRSIGLYGLSKAALAQLARNLAVEWGPHGVRVNAISPGLIRTPLSESLMADQEFMQRRLALTPLRRVGEPEEIAGVAVLLASDAGAFITGQNLVVDGGTLISDGS